MATRVKSEANHEPPVVSRKDSPSFIEGRRSFFDYIDFGTIDPSDGQMRVQLIRAKEGMVEPTGWHYHVCEGQFVYAIKGWIELEFAEGMHRIEEGDTIFIPGGCVHNEIRTSDDMELIEMSVPAKMGTVPCDPPR